MANVPIPSPGMPIDRGAVIPISTPWYAFLQALARLPYTVNADGSVTLPTPLILSGLPTSAAGLPAGSVWNNAGVLNIV